MLPLYVDSTEHQAGIPVLNSSFPLAIYFTQDGAYMSMLLSQFLPPNPNPILFLLSLHQPPQHLLFF